MSNDELRWSADNALKDLFVPCECRSVIPPMTLLRRLDVVTVERPLRGRFAATISNCSTMVEYEPNPERSDTRQNSPQAEGGLAAFLRHEITERVGQ